MYTFFDIGTIVRDVLVADSEMDVYTGGRIYPQRLPADTNYELGTRDLPAIHYEMVDATEQDEAAISWSHWYITCIAKEQRTLNAMCGRVKSLLHGYKAGAIRYMGLTNSDMEYDDETQTPYCVMTFQVTFYKEVENESDDSAES